MKTPKPFNESPLTVTQLAEKIQFHPESVRRCIRAGRIRALLFGNSWRIPPAEVARILANGLPIEH